MPEETEDLRQDPGRQAAGGPEVCQAGRPRSLLDRHCSQWVAAQGPEGKQPDRDN